MFLWEKPLISLRLTYLFMGRRGIRSGNSWEHELIADLVNRFTPGKAKFICIPRYGPRFYTGKRYGTRRFKSEMTGPLLQKLQQLYHQHTTPMDDRSDEYSELTL